MARCCTLGAGVPGDLYDLSRAGDDRAMTDFDSTSAGDPGQTNAASAWGREIDEPDEQDRKNYSWGRNLPALRLSRTPEEEKAQRSRPAPTIYRLTPPWYLRPVRLLLGLGLLAGAWGLTTLLMMWAQYLWSMLPQTVQPVTSVGIFALNVVGALLLAVVTLGLVITGAFSLTLGLTARRW
jgi:hypothetical protein